MRKNQNTEVFLGARTSLMPNKITYLKADINYTTVYSDSGKSQVLSTTIHKVHEFLSGHGNFVRISRQYVVNMQYVKLLKNNKLVLVNGEKLAPSRRRLKSIQTLNF